MGEKSVDMNSGQKSVVRVPILVVLMGFLCSSCTAIPDYLPLYKDVEQEEAIETYFHLGFSYKEILCFLTLYHGFNIGYRQLQRKLRERGLRRHMRHTQVNVLVNAVQRELNGTGSNIGYRSMQQRILTKYKLVASRESVRLILRELDPVGVTLRRQRRLQRREYYVKGPNFLWHIDGWDKLKQFGLCVHGCIDGFSRRIMWLEASSSNNDPKVVCRYFSKCIQLTGCLPRTIRADRGTENVNVEMMQTVLRSINENRARTTHLAFLYGKSTANQRIESWWSKFKMYGMDVWIEHFKALSSAGIIDTSRELDIQCIIFCYVRLLQDELKNIVKLWNTHYIRKSRNEEQPHGRPDTMYHIPELFSGIDGLHSISQTDVDVLSDILTINTPYCKDIYRELFFLVMDENDMRLPKDLDEARNLLVFLLDDIDSELEQ